MTARLFKKTFRKFTVISVPKAKQLRDAAAARKATEPAAFPFSGGSLGRRTGSNARDFATRDYPHHETTRIVSLFKKAGF
jgi:hypothetical protein